MTLTFRASCLNSSKRRSSRPPNKGLSSCRSVASFKWTCSASRAELTRPTLAMLRSIVSRPVSKTYQVPAPTSQAKDTMRLRNHPSSIRRWLDHFQNWQEIWQIMTNALSTTAFSSSSTASRTSCSSVILQSEWNKGIAGIRNLALFPNVIKHRLSTVMVICFMAQLNNFLETLVDSAMRVTDINIPFMINWKPCRNSANLSHKNPASCNLSVSTRLL